MSAELFRAARAGHIRVGVFREPLRMQEESDLPDRKQDNGDAQKTPCVEPRNEEQGREHHSEIPVVDTAGHAAPALEEKHLEGAEEQDADDIGNGEQRAQQKHEILVQYSNDI